MVNNINVNYDVFTNKYKTLEPQDIIRIMNCVQLDGINKGIHTTCNSTTRNELCVGCKYEEVNHSGK